MLGSPAPHNGSIADASRKIPVYEAPLQDTGLKLQNKTKTVDSYLVNEATEQRVWQMPDESGTVALTSNLPEGYTHPATHDPSIIVQDTNNRFVTDAEKTAWNTPQTTVSGNAGTATALQTPRTINGVSFNGTANITVNAVDSTPRVASSLLGAASGVATLDAGGKVPTAQLPSYVDDVLEYANLAAFPGAGTAGIIYVAIDTNKTYRWSGSAYVYITSGAVDSVMGATGVVTATNLGLQNFTAGSTVSGSNTGDNAANTSAAPIAHVGSGGTAHANVIAGGAAGFMTGADKTKLDGVATGATAYTHPANHPPSIITQDASNRFVTDAEKSTWNAKAPIDSPTFTNATNSIVYSTGLNGWGAFYAKGSGTNNAYNFFGNVTNGEFGRITANTGGIVFGTGTSALPQLAIEHVASVVNYAAVQGSATGQRLTIAARGSDTNVGFNYYAKGAEYHIFSTNNGYSQFGIAPVANAVNYIWAGGAVTGGKPYLMAVGADVNVGLNLITKGTGTLTINGNLAWHAGNDGTGSGLDADLLDGVHLDTAYNSFGAGTIPRRHASGYLFSNYFNCTANVESVAPSHIAIQASSDNYIRWQTWAQFKTNLFAAPTFTGDTKARDGIRLGDAVYPTYEVNLDFGADAIGTWRKIVTVALGNAVYSTHGFVINIVDPLGNHATLATPSQALSLRYFVACVRTEATTLDTPDLCVVRGPSSHIRAVKTSTGNYEIQVQNSILYQEMRINISTYATNDTGHTITYHNGSTIGSTGTAQYAASVGNAIDWFQNVKATKYESTVATGTAPLTVASTTAVTNLNADLLDGYQLERLTACLRANRNINGGGTITVNATGYLLWSARFIVISNGTGTEFAVQGYFEMYCPTSGTITGVGGAGNVTATAAGIPLSSWQALYYILPVGGAAANVAANYRIVAYAGVSSVPPEWVLICIVNGDGTPVFYLPNGIYLKGNESINTLTHDARNADLLDGQHGSYYAPLASPGFSGQASFTGSGAMLPASTNLAASVNTSAVMVQSQGASATAGAAFISFHRPSAFAANLGIDTDNKWKVGGWSMGAVSYEIWHAGNFIAGTNYIAPTGSIASATGLTSLQVTNALGFTPASSGGVSSSPLPMFSLGVI